MMIFMFDNLLLVILFIVYQIIYFDVHHILIYAYAVNFIIYFKLKLIFIDVINYLIFIFITLSACLKMQLLHNRFTTDINRALVPMRDSGLYYQ